MKRSSVAMFVFLIALTAPTLLSAKGPTTRITISGGDLAAPIVLADPVLLQQFNVWAGPGTAMEIDEREAVIVHGVEVSPRVPRVRVEGMDGFIVDWRAGEVADRPGDRPRYEVSFFVTHHNTRDARLAYVVLYEPDPSGQGYVYLPGPGDERYRLNVRSIHRRREGRWFYASAAWQNAVTPHLARARRR